MAKLNKMFYHTSKGEKKLNCYYITLPKEMVDQVDFENSEIKVVVKDKKIIIEKA